VTGESATSGGDPGPRRRFGLGRSGWAFEAALAVVAIAVVGAVALVVSITPSTGAGPHAGMPNMAGTQPSGVMAPVAPHSDGLSDSEMGYRMMPLTVPKAPGGDQTVDFRIIGPAGMPETRFPPNATKELHFFIVRDDMTAYQHVHPEVVGDLWRTKVTIPDGGTYRMYAEFTPAGTDPMHPTVLGRNIVIPGDTTHIPLPPPEAEARAGDYTVTRPEGPGQPIVKQMNTLRFAITDPTGRPVTGLETHLGAYGHVSAFNVLSQSVTHMHPLEQPGSGPSPSALTFQAQFAERGEHRMFLEFRAGGEVRTAAFTVFVT